MDNKPTTATSFAVHSFNPTIHLYNCHTPQSLQEIKAKLFNQCQQLRNIQEANKDSVFINIDFSDNE